MAATVIVEGWRWWGSGTVGAQAVEEAAAAEARRQEEVRPHNHKRQSLLLFNISSFLPCGGLIRAQIDFLILRRQFPGSLSETEPKSCSDSVFLRLANGGLCLTRGYTVTR
jgi:hypothetical protein